MLLLIGCCSVLNVSFKYLNLHGMGIIVVWDTGIIQMDVGCILIPQGCDCCKEMLQVNKGWGSYLWVINISVGKLL